jgi:hypothetical protein
MVPPLFGAAGQPVRRHALGLRQRPGEGPRRVCPAQVMPLHCNLRQRAEALPPQHNVVNGERRRLDSIQPGLAQRTLRAARNDKHSQSLITRH